MTSQLEGVFIGGVISATVALFGFLAVWINSRAQLIKLKTRTAEAEQRAAEKANEQEEKAAAFILDQARRADIVSETLRKSDIERRADAEQLGVLKGQISSMQGQIEAAATAAQTRDRELGELRGLLSAEKEEKQRLSARVTEVEEIARGLSNVNALLRGERDSALADKQELHAQLNELQRDVPALKARVTRLEWEKGELVKAVLALGGTLPEGVQHDGSGMDIQTASRPQKTP